MVTIAFGAFAIIIYIVLMIFVFPPVLSAHTAYFYNRFERWDHFTGLQRSIYVSTYRWCEILRLERFE